jgi:prolyl oligopeptidase
MCGGSGIMGAAAEWLISQHYTSTNRLAIQGGSNGGLLVGACVTQRPELVRAVIARVGVMDISSRVTTTHA